MKRIVAFFVVVVAMVFALPVFSQELPALQQAIREYQADNYEEAIEILSKFRREHPASSIAAFFLGMSYKQVGDYERAVFHLTDAATLSPPVKEAPVELIDCLVQVKRYEEAKKWIAEAEKHRLYPAKVAFLKGQIFMAEGKMDNAVAAFEEAKRLDPAYTQAAQLQIGLAYMGAGKYDRAKERLKAAITQDPVTDLATFARRYQDMVEELSFIERPWRFTISILGQYDTNMLQEPYATPSLSNVGKQNSYAMTNTVRVDYVPKLNGPWLFNASYAMVSNVHEKNSTSHDLLANTLSIAPGYNFGRWALNLSAIYTNVLRRDPSYTHYVDTYDVGPLARILLKDNQILELYAGYLNKHYYFGALTPDEDQSSQGGSTYVGYTYFFRNGALINARYRYTYENAKGDNWENMAHTLTLNSIYPIWKSLRFQMGAEATFQNYLSEHTFFHKTRKDNIYNGMAGLVWDLNRYMSLTAQYDYTRAHSNIFLYDYDRSLYSAGVEFRF